MFLTKNSEISIFYSIPYRMLSAMHSKDLRGIGMYVEDEFLLFVNQRHHRSGHEVYCNQSIAPNPRVVKVKIDTRLVLLVVFQVAQFLECISYSK